jgi:hypothetical protein
LTADLSLNLKSFESTDCQSVVDLRDHFGSVYDQPRDKGGDVPKEFGRNLQDEQFDVAIGRLGREFETSFHRHCQEKQIVIHKEISLFKFLPEILIIFPPTKIPKNL